MNLFNRMTENDVGRSKLMKALLIAVASFVLVVAPVNAQQAAQSVPNAGDVTPAGLLVASAAVIVAVVTGVFALLAKYVDNRLAADKADRAEDAAKVQNLTTLIEALSTLGKGMSDQATAAAKDRADASSDRAKLIDIVETKTIAKEGRAEVVKTVNDHIDTTATTLREPLTQAVAALTSASDNVKTATETISQVVTSKELKAELKPILDMLDSLGESVGIVLSRLGTRPLNPAHVPASASVAADSAGTANGGVSIDPKGAA